MPHRGVAAPPVWSCVLLKRNLLLVDHLAHIDQGVAHPAQGGVDAYAGELGDFFEAHVGVVAQDHYFALLGRQAVYQLTYFVVRLTADHVGLGVTLGALEYVEDVEGLRLAYFRPALVATKGDYAHVVADAHRTLQALAIMVVLATAQGVDDFDEHLLKDVLGLAMVLSKEVDAGVDFLLVTPEEFLEGFILSS